LRLLYGCDEGEVPDVSDAIGVGEVMLGLPGFLVLEARQEQVELVVVVETVWSLVACRGCGVVATAHDRMAVAYRDLPAFGRPVRLVWRKRRFRCDEQLCATSTWTETSDLLASRCVLTRRAALECCVQVGANARPVAQVAREFGVAWHTVMDAVREYGRPLVDDPARVGPVRALGVDETKWLSATRTNRTRYTTGLVDLDRRLVIDVIEGNAGADLAGWLDDRPRSWLDAVRVVATDLASAYRAGLGGRLPGALRVADPFHVVRVANRCLDKVRRRVQNQTTGHRGRKNDPLYRIRKLLVKGAERLDGTGLDRMLFELQVGDPDGDVLGAWCAKESVRDIYLTNDPADAELLLDKTIEGCRLDPVEEIRSLGRTLAHWRTEITNHHSTGASNGPTEALNLLIKKVKRAGHGFTCFANYRLRILLHAGGVDWSQLRPPAPPLLDTHPH
jgi:transposase